jgi:hypothetical protein
MEALMDLSQARAVFSDLAGTLVTSDAAVKRHPELDQRLEE